MDIHAGSDHEGENRRTVASGYAMPRPVFAAQCVEEIPMADQANEHGRMRKGRKRVIAVVLNVVKVALVCEPTLRT